MKDIFARNFSFFMIILCFYMSFFNYMLKLQSDFDFLPEMCAFMLGIQKLNKNEEIFSASE